MRLRSRFAIGLALTLCGVGGHTSTADAESERLVLRRAQGVALGAAIEVLLEPATDATRMRRMPASGLRRIELPTSFTGRIGCRGEGVWCPWQTVATEASAIVLPVFRAGRIAGRVVAGREGAPDAVLVEGTVALAGSPDVHFQRQVEVGEGGEIAFEAPHGELDLRFAADGWAPIYRWGFEVGDQTALLGALRFERGSSVSGFVQHGATELPVAGAAVAALPASADELSEDARRRLEALAVGVTTNERGFFQLSGLPPGRYRLDVALEGFFPAGPPTLEVIENGESHLADPIVLFPAARLTVLVDPPHPSGEAGWKVELVPQTGSGSNIRQAVTDERGAVDFEHLTPGAYRVEVSSAEHPTVWDQEVELSSDRILPVELPLVEIVGTLTLDGQPLVARVDLQTGARDRWRYRSDEEGRFGGTLRLPEFDLLFVEIEADDPELRKHLQIRGLEADDGVVELDLALEDRTIDGTVVDDRGRPVAGAEVGLHAGDRRIAEVKTDDDGAFTLRALDRDRYRVHAWLRGQGSSEVVEADLSSTDHAGPFRLTLVRRHRIDGVLRTADGRPVQGGRIEAHTWQPVPYADVARTDLAGRFWFDVPEGAARAHLEIEAPSVGLIAVCARIPASEEDLEIVLPATADASVELDLQFSPDLPPASSGPLVLLRRGGGYLRRSTLKGWSPESGGSSDGARIVRGLFAGEYALGWLDGPPWYKAAAACEPTFGHEPAWQYVGPGGMLLLEYDLEPHQRATARDSSR